MRPQFVVIGGVSGSGKTKLAREVAELLHWRVMDADFFHSQDAIRRMMQGVPLTSIYRKHWLNNLAQGIRVADHLGVSCVIACSLLRPEYRAQIVQLLPGQISVVWLDVDEEKLCERIRKRYDNGEHWFPPSLLKSQLETASQVRHGRTIIGPVPGEEDNVFIIDGNGDNLRAKALAVIDTVPGLGPLYRPYRPARRARA